MNLRRFLVLGEETEQVKCPDWYPLIQAAKYLNVPPWELQTQSLYWKSKALKAMTAESQAQEIINKRQ